MIYVAFGSILLLVGIVLWAAGETLIEKIAGAGPRAHSKSLELVDRRHRSSKEAESEVRAPAGIHYARMCQRPGTLGRRGRLRKKSAPLFISDIHLSLKAISGRDARVENMSTANMAT
jgi:hypothetical protein